MYTVLFYAFILLNYSVKFSCGRNQTLSGYHYPTTPYIQTSHKYLISLKLVFKHQSSSFMLYSPPQPQLLERLDKCMTGVNQKLTNLTKLDFLDELCCRITSIEKHCQVAGKEIHSRVKSISTLRYFPNFLIKPLISRHSPEVIPY
jgi:hypothetical protein